MLPGVRIFDVKEIPDERGFFAELLRGDWNDFKDDDKIIQVNISESNPGTIRAWHRHSRDQVDYLFVVKGTLRVCAYDDREGSKTKGHLDEIVLSGENLQVLRIPGEYWHGTKCIGDEPSTVLYFVTNLYDYENPDEERREWDDPSIVDLKTGTAYDWNE